MLPTVNVSYTLVVLKNFVTRDSEAKNRAWLHSGWAPRAGLFSHMNTYINIYKDINTKLFGWVSIPSALTQRLHGVVGVVSRATPDVEGDERDDCAE